MADDVHNVIFNRNMYQTPNVGLLFVLYPYVVLVFARYQTIIDSDRKSIEPPRIWYFFSN